MHKYRLKPERQTEKMGDQVRKAKETKNSRQENVKRKIKMNEVEPKRIRESMRTIYWRHQVKAPDF